MNSANAPQGSADRAEELRKLGDYELGKFHGEALKAWTLEGGDSLLQDIDACVTENKRRCAEREAQEADRGTEPRATFEGPKGVVRLNGHLIVEAAKSPGVLKFLERLLGSIEPEAQAAELEQVKSALVERGEKVAELEGVVRSSGSIGASALRLRDKYQRRWLKAEAELERLRERVAAAKPQPQEASQPPAFGSWYAAVIEGSSGELRVNDVFWSQADAQRRVDSWDLGVGRVVPCTLTLQKASEGQEAPQ
jgi:hypothetical protein